MTNLKSNYMICKTKKGEEHLPIDEVLNNSFKNAALNLYSRQDEINKINANLFDDNNILIFNEIELN